MVTDQILRVGEALNSIYVLQTLGTLTADDIAKGSARYGNQVEGDLKYQDTNGDGVISEADKVIVGHPSPDYTYGITNTFRYKGFDLSVLIQGQYGGSIYSEWEGLWYVRDRATQIITWRRLTEDGGRQAIRVRAGMAGLFRM